MGLWGEQPLSSFSFKGLELSDESPPFKWEWFSVPLDCSPDEKCNPESMVGTMSPLGGNPRPFQGGEEVRCLQNKERYYTMKVSQMLISVLIEKEIVNEGVELEKDGLAGK